MPDIANDSDDSEYIPQASSHDLSERVKYHRKMMQNFWEQWQKEYLTSLREQHSLQRNTYFSGETVTVEKIALIHDETPRNQWKLGLITQPHEGKDGFTRPVTSRTANRNHIARPIKKLYPIKV